MLLAEFDGVSSVIKGGGIDTGNSSIGEIDLRSIVGDFCLSFECLDFDDASALASTGSMSPKTLSLCVLESSLRLESPTVLFKGRSTVFGDGVLDESAETCFGEFPVRKSTIENLVPAINAQM
jgi:hypothetical protein